MRNPNGAWVVPVIVVLCFGSLTQSAATGDDVVVANKKAKWIPLAPLVQAGRDTHDARWNWDGKVATFAAGKPIARVSIPQEIHGSYELQTRVTVVQAKEQTSIYLPITLTRYAILHLRGDSGNTASPTATILLEGPTPAPQPQSNAQIEIGAEYFLACTVVKTGDRVAIEIRCEERVLFQWSGLVSQIAEVNTMRPGTVHLQTAYYTSSRFADLRLRMLAEQSAVVAHWGLVSDGPDRSRPSSDTTESVLKDLTGNGHDGHLFGDPTFRDVVFPTSGKPLVFDGGHNRVFVADDPAFQLTKSLTIEAYIAVDRYPSAAAEMGQIVFRGDDRPGLDPWFLAITSAGTLRFAIANENNLASVLESPDPIPMGPLLHIAATLDHHSGTQSLLINHKRVATTKTEIRSAGQLTGNRPGIGIGNWAVFSYQAFAGIIHGVRISRQALPTSQLQAATATPPAAAPTAPITAVAGVKLFHSVRLDRLRSGATVSVGQGKHEFVDVRPPLLGLYYTNRDPYQGATRFSVEQDQTVYAAFYGRDWSEGGNPSGDWQHEVNSPDQLQAMGWRKTGQLRVRHSNPESEEQFPWIVYGRFCRAGEAFTLRNHKYQAPILIWGHTEDPVSLPTPLTTPLILGSGFGPASGGIGPPTNANQR